MALVPVALGAAGFTSAGVAAGSVAAKLMSAAAVANGGGVAAGSAVAVLQSAGRSHNQFHSDGFNCDVQAVTVSARFTFRC